ncbi:efflux RND transporter periplasmic adaptor subunit [Aestuariibaculum lutulentum]|uniref:Efflux RND transporter periplasmic adaptor subunit n=1 Tax=Aestuariibaculum lutulentum TaxID=2920935 RepID=A0ABS9RH92_9FLAO|nr:efflux RND transporter periplasmic adaptor subunit [Aestuariibaculum lutulentum]MCH4552317.1 efflux RND transporter periplasmic adaptor subunit [Aestuariibaculum lutulentum]
MKKKYIPFLLLGILAFLFSGCGDKTETKSQSTAPLPFPVAELRPVSVTGYEEYPTSIEGIVNSNVRAKTSGYIQQVLVDEGQQVRKGQSLFKLETQTLSQDANAAKARVNVAQVEVDKLIPLVDKGIISEVQLETAKANLEQAKANYNSIVANIGYATVKSPVDGYVGAINFREGSLVSPNDAMPLTTVSDIEEVYAFFSLNEAQYVNYLQSAKGQNKVDRIKNLPQVNLILANGQVYSEKGTIETSTGQINTNTGTINIRAKFDNPNEILTNGNSGNIRIPTEYKNVIVVPQSATFEQQKDVVIYTLGSDNKIKATVIKVSGAVDNLYVVESGLKAGDNIVVSGLSKLRNSMVITPKQVDFDSVIKPIAPMFK